MRPVLERSLNLYQLAQKYVELRTVESFAQREFFSKQMKIFLKKQFVKTPVSNLFISTVSNSILANF